MKIIVESGATKSDWRLLEGGEQKARLLRDGMNLSTTSAEAVRETFSKTLAELGVRELEGFYFYTAGIVTPGLREEFSAAVRSVAKVEDIDIQDDMVGAARSVCGRSQGIVAILGTGSNACFYDGVEIHRNVLSGGFIIGDDGGAAALGRLFLRDYIKNLIPSEVAREFASEFDASYEAIVQGVYRSPAPAKYLGSLAPFIVSHCSDPYIKGLVEYNFREFITRSLLQYDTARYPVGVVGGFGYACREIFEPLAREAGVRIRSFEREPVDGLIAYHSAE